MDTGIDRQIVKTTESVIRSMNSSYTSYIAECCISVKQAAMALLNIAFLQKTMVLFETDMEELKICQGVKLNVKESFESAIQNLELQVSEILTKYVIQTMEKGRVNIAWTPEKADKIPKQHITELADFVINTLPQQISGLTEDLCLKLYWRFYEVLMQQFMGLLTKEGVQFNRNCARGLLIDLQVLEEAAKRCPIPEVIVGFEEPRQILTLLTSDSPKEFLDEKIRQTKYNRLTNFKVVLNVLNQFNESSTIASRFNIGFLQDDHTKQVEALRTFLRTHQ